jgi:hypothetical protein
MLQKKESLSSQIKFFGYRNMILIEKKHSNSAGTSITTKIIAGSSTELKNIRTLDFDKKIKKLSI